jgi:mono/diheme cytochrome c family protein
MVMASLAWAGRPTKRLSDDDRGKLLYDRHCVQCHGATAAGDGLAAAALVKPVPDLRDGKLSSDNREAMAAVVLDGRNVMPSFEMSFDRYDARRVMRWMEKQANGKTAVAPPEPTEPADAPDEDP